LTDDAAVFTMPKNPDGRYYNVQFSDFYSDVYGYISLLDGEDISGEYLVVGPNYKEDLDETKFKKVIRSPTNWTFVIARTFTDATEADLKICHAIQDQYKLTMISELKSGKKTERRDVLDILDPRPTH
jgi:hypothetical protein